MRLRSLRGWTNLGLIAAGAYLMQGSGCISFIGEAALMVTDACFVFDCTDAAGGGIEFCSGQGSGAQTFEGQNNVPLLNDCPSP